MAKKVDRAKSVLKAEEYLVCEACGTLVPRGKIQRGLFGANTDCPTCEEELKPLVEEKE